MTTTNERWNELKRRVTEAGQVSDTPDRTESVGFVYGTTHIENANVTREMAKAAVETTLGKPASLRSK